MNSSDGISHESKGGTLYIDELATFENVINNQEINFKKNPGIDKDEDSLRLFWPSFRRPSDLWRAESLHLSSSASFLDFWIYSAWNNNNRRESGRDSTQRRQTIKESDLEKSSPHRYNLDFAFSFNSISSRMATKFSGRDPLQLSSLSYTSLCRHRRRPTTDISHIFMHVVCCCCCYSSAVYCTTYSVQFVSTRHLYFSQFIFSFFFLLCNGRCSRGCPRPGGRARSGTFLNNLKRQHGRNRRRGGAGRRRNHVTIIGDERIGLSIKILRPRLSCDSLNFEIFLFHIFPFPFLSQPLLRRERKKKEQHSLAHF